MSSTPKRQTNFFKVKEPFKALFRQSHIMLFLDFDGTLAAIVDHYQSATILQESKMLLSKIAKDPSCSVFIVSGRALSDVKKRVGLKRVTYAGNHGLEIEGPKIKYTFFVKMSDRIRFKLIKHDLMTHVGHIKGVLIEDKGLSLTVHYRLIELKNLALFKKKFLECLGPYLRKKEVSLREGKKVFEIIPKVKWDKGKAVLWLIDHFQRKTLKKKIFSVFIGDDVTDETAFIALKKKGLCIRVGASKISAAPYYLKDIKDVPRFLETVLDSKGELKESPHG